MAYANKNIDDVYNLLVTSFQEKFNSELQILPKSFVKVLCKVLAGVYIIPFKLCGWFYLQLFPDTASYKDVIIQGHKVNPLIKLGDLFGVPQPAKGDSWNGTITVIVTDPAAEKVLQQGTQLKSDLTGLIYCVSENTALDAATVEVPVYCTTAGTAGSLAVDSVLKFVNPLAICSQEAKVSSTTQAGTEDETEAHYRKRVQTRYSTQPQGGALADYRNWAFDIAGVLQTYPYNDENSPGGVLLYVAGNSDLYTDRIPDSALLKAVGNACTYDPDTGVQNRKPITAIIDPAGDETYINVMPVRVTSINVFVNNLTGVAAADFGADFKAAAEDFLLNREPYIRGLSDDNNRTDSILRNSLAGIANDICTSYKGDFGELLINAGGASISSYTLGQGELCKLGDLYIDGVLYEE